MPSISAEKRVTSPKERIIPIQMEDKSNRKSDTFTFPNKSKTKKEEPKLKSAPKVAPSVKALTKSNEDQWEVAVESPKKKDAKKAKEYETDANKNPVDKKKDKKTVKNEKQAKVDKNENDNSKAIISSEKKMLKPDKNNSKKKVKSEVSDNSTITTQPGKSILKHPIASSTPIPEADDESWHNRSTASAGTIVHKPTSKKSKCRSWLCMPCGLCCACSPFECECCDCCYLRCTRCEQCLCQCCSRNCCT